MPHNIKGQSEAARNARLDRACCPTHGHYMGQISGWWYPLDEPPFTLVACGRSDCDVICKSVGPDGPVSAPLSKTELRALQAEHSEHGLRWTIEYFTHFMRTTALDAARKRRDAGALSADDYETLAHYADLLKTIAQAEIRALTTRHEEADHE